MKPLVSVVIVTKDRKKDLVECIDSYLASSYKPLQIIVVDNASRPPIKSWFPKEYSKVKVITTNENVGAAEGRNIGFAESKGKYILFTDDDAYAAKDMVAKLVKSFAKTKDAGIIQPLVYDKQKKDWLQGAGHDINANTGRIRASGVREKDVGQYDGLRRVPMCGCVWMVKREVFEKIGDYDVDYFIPYEDSDFSIRARRAGYGLYCDSSAKTWHQGPKKTYVHPRVEWLGITSPDRAYRVARNKIIFVRKHSSFIGALWFFVILLPFYALSHSVIIITTFRFDILARYWLGVLSGLAYAVYSPLLKFRESYQAIDKKLSGFKRFLEAWTDPLPWIVDKKSKTVLDLASGLGRPMQLIKQRMSVSYAEGVDLYKPYIEFGNKEKIHDKYVLKDIRHINYKENSFDIVIASSVLEHMSRKDAWKLLGKMEKIARRQVIIATPIGEMYHHAEDGNLLQLHKSHFFPEDFEKKGYKTIRYGWRWLLGEKGIVHKVKGDFVRKILYLFNILVTPIYYLIPSLCDYTFVAYKNINAKT